MNTLIVFLIGIAVGIVIQLAYSLVEMFRFPERYIEAAQQVIDLKEYKNKGY